MKKLMFAAAVAAGFAAFGDGLESANTVGYLNNNGTVAGLNMVGPGFQDVGLTSTKLMGLKVSNAQGGEVGTGTCVINLIDENGNTLKSYSWASQGRGANKTWGWEERGTRVDDTVVFGRGVGLLFTAQTAGDIFKSQGEVNLSGITFNDTVAGLNIVANPFPTTIKLNTLRVTTAADGEVGTGTCVINLIDENGNTLKSYTWASQGRGANKTWGWEEAGTRIDDTVTLVPGQAILFTAQTAGDKLIFPAQE